MTLAHWLKANGKNLDWLGTQLGLSTASASRIVRGKQPLALETALLIEKLTGGAVTPAALHESHKAAVAAQPEVAA